MVRSNTTLRFLCDNCPPTPPSLLLLFLLPNAADNDVDTVDEHARPAGPLIDLIVLI